MRVAGDIVAVAEVTRDVTHERTVQAKLRGAEEKYRTVSDFMPSYANMAFTHNAKGNNDRAEASFLKALTLDPNSPVVHLNLGMLLSELKRPNEAERAFRAALKADPNSAAAACNLGILLAEDKPKESLTWCRRAFRLRPNEGKYGYTYAFYLHQRGETSRAIAVLEGMVNRRVRYADADALLGSIYL